MGLGGGGYHIYIYNLPQANIKSPSTLMLGRLSPFLSFFFGHFGLFSGAMLDYVSGVLGRVN